MKAGVSYLRCRDVDMLHCPQCQVLVRKIESIMGRPAVVQVRRQALDLELHHMYIA